MQKTAHYQDETSHAEHDRRNFYNVAVLLVSEHLFEHTTNYYGDYQLAVYSRYVDLHSTVLAGTDERNYRVQQAGPEE